MNRGVIRCPGAGAKRKQVIVSLKKTMAEMAGDYMSPRERNSLISVLRVLALRGIGVVLGIASAFLLAVFLGASAIVDAYFFARRTIGSVQSISDVLIETLMVPSLVAHARKDGAASLRGLSRRLEWVTFAVAAVVCTVLALAAGPVVDTLAPGLAPESRGPAMLYFAILLITIPITLIAAIKSATLLALRHFSRPAMARLLPRLALVAVLLLVPLGVDLSWAVVAFVIGNALMLLIFFRLAERALSQAPAAPIPEGKRRIGLSAGHGVAIIIFAIGTLIETTLDTYFASLAGVGALAVLTIGQRISNVGASELNRSLLAVYYTNFAEYAAEGNRPAFAREVTTAMRSGLFFLAPLGFYLFALAEPLCRVLLDFGAFDDAALALTAQVVALVAIATVLRSPVAVIENAVLSDMSARHIPFATLSIVLGLAARIGVALTLLPSLGLLAVVWSAIASTAVKLALGMIWLRIEGLRLAAADLRRIAVVLGLGMAAAALAGGLVGLLDDAPRGVLALALVGASAASFAAYVAVAARVGVPEAGWLGDALRRKLSR